MHTRAALVLLAGSLALGACAAPQRRLVDENRRLAVEVAELRASARADRRLIRDLENRLALARAAMAAEGAVVQEAPTATPPAAEPITRMEHGGAAAPAPAPSLAPGAAVAYADDDVEIIYEGEAAQRGGKRPRLTLHERAAYDDDGDDLDSTPIVLTEGAGQLPVTRGEIPTVDAQLRRARSAPVRARPGLATDPRDEYQRYYAALEAGNHAYAVTGFRHFVERYPDHDFADNAQYWLGESYYDQKDYRTATAEFRKVVDRYPRGNKVADALLKLAFCEQALGRKDEAKKLLRQVVEHYPKTSPATLAAERLGALERTP